MLSAFELPYQLVRSIRSAIYWYLKNRSHIGSGAIIKNSSLGINVRVGMLSTIINSQIGDYARVGEFNKINNSTLGMFSYTGSNTRLQNCKIGNYTSISWNVTIGPPEHKLDEITTHTFSYDPVWDVVDNELYDQFSKPCEVGHDVWIGANVVILRGAKVGTGAIIGAGAVVTKDIPDYAIAVGVPARVIKYRFPRDVIKHITRSKWWEYPPETALTKIKQLREELNDKI